MIRTVEGTACDCCYTRIPQPPSWLRRFAPAGSGPERSVESRKSSAPIEVGGSVALPPSSHHRTCGSASGGS